ncbi:Mur ligase family protein [SAR86 cluster bacterium]|nr:Mur ligase family protein [SAR86 cluster bacterium]
MSVNNWLNKKVKEYNQEKIDLSILKDFILDLEISIPKKIISIVGTNGKGSTANLISKILKDNSYSVGLYTSPHLINYNERIDINGININDEVLKEYFSKIEKKIKTKKLNFYQMLSLTAFKYFSDNNLDIWVLEAGLGGRLDPINCFDADLSIITNISLDHQEILGSDIDSIGKEKAGILRNNQKLIFGDKKIPESVIKIIDSLNVDLHKINNQDLKEDFHLNKHSVKIAKKAIELIDPKISKKSIFNSIRNTKILGRCHLISNELLVDVAHNEDAIKNLKSFIESRKLNKNGISAIFHCSKSKNPISLISPLNGLIKELRIPKIENFRLLDEEHIKESLGNNLGKKIFIDETIEKSIKEIRSLKPKCLILIFGSFYLAGEFYKLQLRKNV